MINIGLLGNGTVGSGVLQLIERNGDALAGRTGKKLNVKKVLVRDLAKHTKQVDAQLLTDKVEDVLAAGVDIVVEVMGGVHPAYDYIKESLNQGKHVVTANKEVISRYGSELLELAREKGVSLHFEASVGGGMPVIKPLSESLSANTIQSISGILNGTTNFILTKMYEKNMDYDTALRLAQEAGFAESDPSADVLGLDAARKLSILSSIAYGEQVSCEKIKTEGICDIDTHDFAYARHLGCNIKLLAQSSRDTEGIYAAVRPVLVPKESSLGKAQNEYNYVSIDGDATGPIGFYGKGAGQLPTASAVLSDIIAILEGGCRPVHLGKKTAIVKTCLGKEANWLIRFECPNRMQAISAISRHFSNYMISSIKGNDGKELILQVKIDSETTLDKAIQSLVKDGTILSARKRLILNEV